MAKPSDPRLPLSALDRPAVFETLRVYAGRTAGLDLHLDRLRASARSLGIPVPAIRILKTRILNAVERSGFADAIARFSVCASASLGSGGQPGPMFCLIRPFAGSPETWYASGVAVRTSSVRRIDPRSMPSQVKGNDYMNALNALVSRPVSAIADAGRHPIVDELFLNTYGEVAETTVSNIGMIRHGVLWTPPAPCGILLGVTRRIVLQMARAEGLDVREAPVTRHDLFNADEVFLMNTAVEVLPVVEVDARRIGDGKPGIRSARLREAYRHHVIGVQ